MGLNANPHLRKTNVSCRFIMERTIRTLKEMREKAEKSFIENSIIGPIPQSRIWK